MENWQALAWDTEEAIAKKKGVDKRGAKGDEAYVREVLGENAMYLTQLTGGRMDLHVQITLVTTIESLVGRRINARFE